MNRQRKNRTSLQGAIALFALGLLLPGSSIVCADEAEADGYALFTQACEEHSKLGAQDVSSEGIESFATGGALSTGDVAWVVANTPVFARLETAWATSVWSLPDNRTYSAESTFPNVARWRSINRVATIKAILMVQDGDAREAVEFLGRLHEIGIKVNREGTLIHLLVHFACRGMQYPVLTSAVDSLPPEDLPVCFASAKNQYEQIPPVEEALIGDHYMARNTAKGLFSDLRTNGTFHASWTNMIVLLGEQDVDPHVLQQMRNEEILSVAQWETQVMCDLTNIQAYYESTLSTGAPSTFMALQDELEARIMAKCNEEVPLEKTLEMMNRFVSDTGTNTFSLPAATALHDEIGSAVSWAYLGLMVPATGMYGIRYCEYLARERLLLIRMASRIYESKHGRAPESLQDLVTDDLLNKNMIEDPFSQRPFLVKKDDTGFVVYSVGRDFDDDGGHPWSSETDDGDAVLVPLLKEQAP